MASSAVTQADPSSRQRLYSSDAPVGKSRSQAHVVRNRVQQPLRSFSPERSPYLYSSVTSNGCFTVGSPTKFVQARQQRDGSAPCPVVNPPPLDTYARRGFNEFDYQQRGVARQTWRAYEKYVLEPAQREELIDELLALSPVQFSQELTSLQKARRDASSRRQRTEEDGLGLTSPSRDQTGHRGSTTEHPRARTRALPPTADSTISSISPRAGEKSTSTLWSPGQSRTVSTDMQTPHSSPHARHDRKLFDQQTPLSVDDTFVAPPRNGSMTMSLSSSLGAVPLHTDQGRPYLPRTPPVISPAHINRHDVRESRTTTGTSCEDIGVQPPPRPRGVPSAMPSLTSEFRPVSQTQRRPFSAGTPRAPMTMPSSACGSPLAMQRQRRVSGLPCRDAPVTALSVQRMQLSTSSLYAGEGALAAHLLASSPICKRALWGAASGSGSPLFRTAARPRSAPSGAAKGIASLHPSTYAPILAIPPASP